MSVNQAHYQAASLGPTILVARAPGLAPPAARSESCTSEPPTAVSVPLTEGGQCPPPELIPFPPRISSLMHPNQSSHSICGRIASTAVAVDAYTPQTVPAVEDPRAAVGPAVGQATVRGQVETRAVAAVEPAVGPAVGPGHDIDSDPLPLPNGPAGGTRQRQQARLLAHALSTSFLSGRGQAGASVSSVPSWSTRSPASVSSTCAQILPLAPLRPSSYASAHAPRTMSKSPPPSPPSPPPLTTSSRCLTGTQQRAGARLSATLVQSRPPLLAAADDHRQHHRPLSQQQSTTADTVSVAGSQRPRLKLDPAAGQGNQTPSSPTQSSPTLFHRAASFLNKFTGSTSTSSTSQGSDRAGSPGNHKSSAPGPAPPLCRRPSLPISASQITGTLNRGNTFADANATNATHSQPPTGHIHALAISHTHPLSASLVDSRAVVVSSPHLPIASAPPVLAHQSLRHSPSPHAGHATTSMNSPPPPPSPPLPPASPRPASIRSVASNASKRAPSIKVSAKKRFGWSRRFFRFKDRPDLPHSPSPPSTGFALGPIADDAGSGSFFSCAKHVACSKARLPEHASPTCCVASPRLAVNVLLSAVTSDSSSSRPLVTAGDPLRPSTPIAGGDADTTHSSHCPPIPNSPTASIRCSRPPLASPNPTSISRSTSLASTTSVRRQHPRLERVHAEDRHDPAALAHRLQLSLSATASDILVRNYRKSPRALVVALYSATLVRDVNAVASDADSGHGEEEETGERGAGGIDVSEATEPMDGGLPQSRPSFLRQFQELLAHSVVPHQLLFPPGTVESPSLSTSRATPTFRHTVVIHADLGLVTPPESPMTPPPPLGPAIHPAPMSSSSFSASSNPSSTKPSKSADPTDAYTLKVAHMLLTHHLAVACLSVIQSIDRSTLLSVLARPRDRVPKLVLQCPSATLVTPASHHRRSSTATSSAPRATDRAALAVQSAIDLAARALYARLVECARLRCPPRTKRRPSTLCSASSASTCASNSLAYLYTSILRGVRLMAYVSAADRELRWTWVGRDASVRAPGMRAAVDAGWDGVEERRARVVFSVFPGLVLVTDNAFDPVVTPVLVPGDVPRGDAQSVPVGGGSYDDDDNVPLWSLPMRPPSTASSTGSTATVHSSSVASRRGSRAPSAGADEGDDDDGVTRGRIVVDEQVFVIPTTDAIEAEAAGSGGLRTSPVVGVETARRRAPGARVVLEAGGWPAGAHQLGTRPATMPVFPAPVAAAAATTAGGLVCRTPSPALTHRLSFGSDTTVVIGDGSSDTEVSGADEELADGVGGEWVDIGVCESFESSMSVRIAAEPAGMAAVGTQSWMASPVRPSTATAVLREALALEWRDMLP